MNGERRQAVGFDFGTTTTLIASSKGIVPIGESRPWMPSVVGYEEDGSVVAGERALELPDGQAVGSIKRSITDQRDFVRVDTPYGLRDVRADDLMVEALREAARRSRANGVDPSAGRLWLGCPAMWDGRQRRRLLEAARQAALPVTLASLVDEPVAAGIAWLASHREARMSEVPLRVVVFDMGGGTLDIAVLDVRGANHHDVSVLAALGVAEAGDALDDAIAEDLDYALGAVGVDLDGLANPGRARARLAYAAREAKVALTAESEVDVKLSRREFGIASLRYRREQLDAVFSAQMDRAEQYVAAALRVARLAEHGSGTSFDIARLPIDTLVEGVDVVVLSGGMSQIPYVAQRMCELFPPTTTVEYAAAPAENAVALGLARAARYGRINMYRPAFDVLLEWEGGEFRTVYEAFTPLVEAWQIIRGGAELCYTRSGPDLSLPRKGRGRLRVVSYSGARVHATLGGRGLDGFPVSLSDQKFEFAIHPNGRIRLTDGAGTHDGQISDWFTMQVHDE